MKPPNPYNYNLPVGPEMFVGREADVETLMRGLSGTPGDSYALVGGRRMGKTSLLEALMREPEPSAGRLLLILVFLDLSGEGTGSVRAFFRTVAEQAWEALDARLDRPPGDPPVWDETRPPARVFRRLLVGWNRAVMEQRGRSLRLVLLLDECEQIVERSWAPDLYGALRSLLVGQTTRALLKVVMTGSHRFLTQVRQQGSPLRNILKYHTLRVLDGRATRALIVRPTGGVLSEEVVQEIARQSGGHPFLTQYLMHHLWERGVESATVETARRIAAGFPHRRGDFRDWMEGLGDSGRRVYAALAQAATPLSEEEVRSALRPPPTDLPQALEALCYHGLVVEEDAGGGYRVAGEMFRQWFFAAVAPRAAPAPPDRPDRLRLRQLADDIRQDLELLKEYEDALRYEDDPRRKARYRREIGQLRESAARYRREYEQLRAQVVGEPTAAMTDVADRLGQMDAKLDALLEGQAAIRGDLVALRRTVLDRFDAGERALIAAWVERLDQAQLETVATVLEAIDAGTIPTRELEETLVAVRAALTELREGGTPLEERLPPGAVERLAEAVDAPRLDVRHKLKVALPIIPWLLSYEGEIELGSGLNLEEAWRRIVSRVRGGE